MTALADPQELANALGVPLATVMAWSTDLATLADSCLSSLDATKAERALYYLTGYFINNEKGQAKPGKILVPDEKTQEGCSETRAEFKTSLVSPF